jgi:hypothetical protein
MLDQIKDGDVINSVVRTHLENTRCADMNLTPSPARPHGGLAQRCQKKCLFLFFAA